jgi:hypothetical protein
VGYALDDRDRRSAVFRCDWCGTSAKRPLHPTETQVQINQRPPRGWRLSGIRHACLHCAPRVGSPLVGR